MLVSATEKQAFLSVIKCLMTVCCMLIVGNVFNFKCKKAHIFKIKLVLLMGSASACKLLLHI